MKQPKPEWQVIVDLLRETNPVLLKRIGRKMINHLFKRGVKRIEELLAKLQTSKTFVSREAGISENQPAPRINDTQFAQITDEIFQIAAQHLSTDDINEIIRLWVKQEQARFLTMAAERRDVPLGEISDALHRFSLMPHVQEILPFEEGVGLRVALIRRFLSEDLAYIKTMKDHVSVTDFGDLLSRTIGPAGGNGKLGGKAAGLIRAKQILADAKKKHPILAKLQTPKTWYISSDGVMDFIHFNALEEMPTVKYGELSEIRQDYVYVEQIFKHSFLSPEIMAKLKIVLNDFGETPLIVRSSSLLEDTQGSAFAGKYKSLFVANQGTMRKRLEALADAITEVYSSVYGPDPIEYRRERGLLDFNEEMAVMIQEVVGTKIGKYYLPAFAGVALSNNEFRWSPRIKRKDGIIRLVTGLGTRAVDRIDDDYPMLVCPGQPGLRTNVTSEEIIKYSQKNVDLINLQHGQFETVGIDDLIQEVGFDFPLITYLFSTCEDKHSFKPISFMSNFKEHQPIVTFSNLIENTSFIAQIKCILEVLEEGLGGPVDIEFVAGEDVNSLYLLQCRPQSQNDQGPAVSTAIPMNVAQTDQLFSAKKFVTSGHVQGMEYIVYVDPSEYDRLGTRDEMINVGRIIGALNRKLPQRKFILMGPGRWGSRGDIKLGVQITYSEINNTAMLIEIARKKKDYVPDLSFGTHFFQDLVEAKIRYLPLYPDEPGIIFNEEFLTGSPNAVTHLIPHSKSLSKVIRVIHIPEVVKNATVSIVMDGDLEQALGFLKRG